ncbi:MAG TPA: thiopurine S-methyltransferase, partial [Planctomycetota bacterium]|nr:thiopurine S-methyltransferase [Planctomycetota bacterium]
VHHDFWLQRWHDNNIGFHRASVHPALIRHWRRRGGSVLVPLCGKSLDLRWLAERGHDVIGVELAERAIRDFFAEQQLTFTRRDGELPAFVAQQLPITIHQGDYFALSLPPCDALYDRAALIALPPEQRAAYAAHTDSLLRDGAERLVITLEYEQAAVQGPPFSVFAEEVLRHWPDLLCIERREAIDEAPPKFRQAGLTTVAEVVWHARGQGPR